MPSRADAEPVLHDWLLEEREQRRHESRRGRRHAFEHLDPRRTALVVIDLVPFFVGTGTVTNVCVEASVRDAATLGLRDILVADACAAMRDQDHNATLHVVYRTYGDVRSTADVIGLVRAGAPIAAAVEA